MDEWKISSLTSAISKIYVLNLFIIHHIFITHKFIKPKRNPHQFLYRLLSIYVFKMKTIGYNIKECTMIFLSRVEKKFPCIFFVPLEDQFSRSVNLTRFDSFLNQVRIAWGM